MDLDETLYPLFSRENNNLGFFNITLQSPGGWGLPPLVSYHLSSLKFGKMPYKIPHQKTVLVTVCTASRGIDHLTFDRGGVERF